jgi:hypothetical protein
MTEYIWLNMEDGQYSLVEAGMLVGSYLGERAQFVTSGGEESSVGAVTCGIPQGYFLGLLLFISYNDDVSRVIGYCRFHIYANDMQIYYTITRAVSNFQRCIDELHLDFQRVHKWAATNGPKLNPIKSQVIVISRCRVDIPPPTLLIGSDVIKVVPKVNNLGFVLNESLLRLITSRRCASLRPHESHTPFEVRRRLVVSLIMPHIGYGDIVLCWCRCCVTAEVECGF